jgi:hypothetical protein
MPSAMTGTASTTAHTRRRRRAARAVSRAAGAGAGAAGGVSGGAGAGGAAMREVGGRRRPPMLRPSTRVAGAAVATEDTAAPRGAAGAPS